MPNYNGLTRNQWPGTWSPSSNHPIALDTEIRGGLRYVSGVDSDTVVGIHGQRLQDGMVVYVKNAHGAFEADRYYKYQLGSGQHRDSNTGELPNASSNWAPFQLDSAGTIALIDSDYIQARQNDSVGVATLASNAEKLGGQLPAHYLDFNNITNPPALLDTVDVSNIITNDVDKTFVDALGINADKLDGLDRQQFLRADQSDSMVGSLHIDSNLVIGGYIAGPATFFIDPNAVGDNTGKVVIKGDLQVDGTQTIVNSTTVTINDKNIVLADSASDSAEADGAGITVNGADATITYSATSDKWEFNKDISASNINATLAGSYSGFDSDFDVRLATKTTTDVAEGTNLYYTTARHDSDTLVQVDSAYVQAREGDKTFGLAGNTGSHTFNPETETLTFLGTTGQINAGIAANNVTLELDQNINSITSIAFEGDSTNALETKLQAVNPTADNTINLPNSSGTIALVETVDSNYVQQRTRIGDSDIDFGSHKILYANVYGSTGDLPSAATYHGMFAHVHGTGRGYFAHAGAWIPLANQSELFSGAYADLSGKPSLDFLDSALTTELIDSAYVQARQTAQDFAYSSLTGKPTLPSFGNDFIDSATVLDIVNSAGLDSDLVIALVDSAYIQLRDRFQDSSLVTSTVDTSYVRSRQIQYNTSDFLDSNTVSLVIDSAYVNARVSGADSSINASEALNADKLDGQHGSYYLNYNNLNNLPSIPNVDKSYVDALNVDADTLDGQHGSYYLNYNNLSNTPTVLTSTDVRNIFNSNGDDEISTGAVVDAKYIEFPHDGGTQHTYTVEVVSKTSAHRYQGTGSSNGYRIDGVESPFLQLVPGNTYRFDQSNGTNSTHQIRFYLDAAKTTAYTTGVTLNGNAGSSGDYTEIVISESTPPVLYYQCVNHGYMGNAVFTQTRNLTGFTTDDLTEGSSNLYYSDALAIQLIDSDYVQSRQTTGGTVDSAGVTTLVTNLVDSAYVSSRYTGAGITLATARGGISVTTDAALEGGALTYDNSTGVLTFNPITRSIADGITLSKFVYTATGGQVTFTDADDNGNLLSYDDSDTQINVYLNGILLVDSDDFTLTDSSTVTLTTAAALNDVVQIIKYTPPSGGGGGGSGTVDSANIVSIIDSDYVQARTSVNARGTLEVNKFFFYATAGQVLFQGADKFNSTLAIDPTNAEVYLNGVLQEETTDYALLADRITFTDALDSGYSVTIIETIGRVNSRQTLSETSFEFTADSGDTVFSGTDNNGRILDLATGAIQIYLNGILLSETNDYTKTNSAVTLLDAADSADFMSVVVTSANVASSLNTKQFHFAGVAGKTLTGNGLAFSGGVQVFKNDVLLDERTDYITTLGNKIILTDSAIVTDEITIQTFNAQEFSGKTFDFVAENGQTIFSGDDRYGNSLLYQQSGLVVYLNGIALVDSADYVATDGNRVTFNTPVSASDEVKISTFMPADLSSVATPLTFDTFEYVATAGQTHFTGTDFNGLTLSYSTGLVNVYLNGLLLRTEDFKDSSGSVLTLTDAADAGDNLTITKLTGNNIGIDAAEAQSLITTRLATNPRTWIERTSSVPITSGSRNIVDTSSGFKTLTLPLSANFGDEIRIIDGTGNASTNNITINRNGHKIQGGTTDLVIDIDRAAVGLVYYNAANGWILIEN